MSRKGKPRIFVGSSVEGLPLAEAIQMNLTHEAQVTIWNQGVFNLTETALESLLTHMENTDFAVFIFSPDDKLVLREKELLAARDNVIFELGLCLGKLGPRRTFFVKPRGLEEFHIPTDLFGINAGEYEIDRDDGNWPAALGVFCSQLKQMLAKEGRIELNVQNMIGRNERLESQLRFLYSLIKHSSHIELKHNRIMESLLTACRLPDGFYLSASTLFSLVGEELVQIGFARDVDEGERFRLDHNERYPENKSWVVAAFLSNQSVMGFKGQVAFHGEYEYIICIPIANTYVVTAHIVTKEEIAREQYQKLLDGFAIDNKPLFDTLNTFLERGVAYDVSQQQPTQTS